MKHSIISPNILINIRDESSLGSTKLYLPLAIKNHIRAVTNLSKMEEARKTRLQFSNISNKNLKKV